MTEARLNQGQGEPCGFEMRRNPRVSEHRELGLGCVADEENMYQSVCWEALCPTAELRGDWRWRTPSKAEFATHSSALRARCSQESRGTPEDAPSESRGDDPRRNKTQHCPILPYLILCQTDSLCCWAQTHVAIRPESNEGHKIIERIPNLRLSTHETLIHDTTACCMLSGVLLEIREQIIASATSLGFFGCTTNSASLTTATDLAIWKF